MAYNKINWENGSVRREGYVLIDGQQYQTVQPEYEGDTPINADNLNHMDEGIKEADTISRTLITYQDFSSTNSLNANTEGTFGFSNISLEGYTPIGIIQIDTDNNVDLLKFSVFTTDAYIRLKNISNSTKNVNCTIRVLYMKNL